jgi:hypothetical protein
LEKEKKMNNVSATTQSLPAASAADILRAHEKNEYYLKDLNTKLLDICHLYFGKLAYLFTYFLCTL